MVAPRCGQRGSASPTHRQPRCFLDTVCSSSRCTGPLCALVGRATQATRPPDHQSVTRSHRWSKIARRDPTGFRYVLFGCGLRLLESSLCPATQAELCSIRPSCLVSPCLSPALAGAVSMRAPGRAGCQGRAPQQLSAIRFGSAARPVGMGGALVPVLRWTS
jgi:hypothetical protein